jgi:DNA gyrase/topoisomerase IV subunit A
MSVDFRLKDFINQDLKVFSNLDNVRSIPSLIDGFKDSQRKAVFGLFKHGTSEIKVAQLGSHAAMVSHYEHGEVSMCDTIVRLAQSFPGSNNVNLFEPIGQFGSILSAESSAHRYIFTKPSVNLRKYIRREDDLILEHREDDGDKLEPIMYFPVLPMWILNGVDGIGTGHSVKILSRDPKKVASLVRRMVNGVNIQQRTIDDAMTPSFTGWNGQVVKGESDSQWELHGSIEKINTTTLKVKSLPITYDVDKFKSILIKLMDDGVIKDFENDSNETSGFNFTIIAPRETVRKTTDELKALFKLVVKVGENVTLWLPDKTLKRFDNVYGALEAFVAARIVAYAYRKGKQLKHLGELLEWAKTRIAFIQHWNTKLKDPHKKSRVDLEKELDGVIDNSYLDRLLSLQISSLTMEKVKELEAEKSNLEAEISKLESSKETDLYCADLDSL